MLTRKNANRKSGSHWFLEGKRISSTDAQARARGQKNLDHVVFLKANNSATLVLDCECANRKNIEHRIKAIAAALPRATFTHLSYFVFGTGLVVIQLNMMRLNRSVAAFGRKTQTEQLGSHGFLESEIVFRSKVTPTV